MSPDGAHIAFRRGALTYDGLWGREEWVMRSDGTEQVKVAADKSDELAGGSADVVSRRQTNRLHQIELGVQHARTSSVEVNEWQNASAVTLFSDSRLSPALHWLPDGRLIYALGSAQHQQDSSLWAVSLQQSGKISSPPEAFTRGHGWISQVTGSADGKVLIFLSGELVAECLHRYAGGGRHTCCLRTSD